MEEVFIVPVLSYFGDCRAAICREMRFDPSANIGCSLFLITSYYCEMCRLFGLDGKGSKERVIFFFFFTIIQEAIYYPFCFLSGGFTKAGSRSFLWVFTSHVYI